MSLGFFRSNAPLTRGDGVASPFFLRWLRALFTDLGYSKDTPIYRPLRMTPIGFPPLAAIAGDLSVPHFPASSTAEMRFMSSLPNDYISGTRLEPSIRWAPADATAGNVLWRVKYSVVGLGGVVSETSFDMLDAAGQTADGMQLEATEDPDSSDAIPKTGLFKGDAVLITLQRVGGDASDTYAGAAQLLDFDIKYQAEGIGTVSANPVEPT